MREIRQSGSEGGEGDKRPSLPLSTSDAVHATRIMPVEKWSTGILARDIVRWVLASHCITETYSDPTAEFRS